VEVKSGSGTERRYVLLIDPDHVISSSHETLRAQVGNKFFDDWHNAYKETRVEFGMNTNREESSL
jgi:hypothetical protein